MANIAIISSKDLAKSDDNPTGCWSAQRYTYNCHKCDTFRRALAGSSNMEETLGKLRCKPFIAGGIVNKFEGYFEAKKNYNEALRILKLNSEELE